MADGQRTLTANFTADTSGFSPKVNELIQKLKTLNQDFEQNKSKVRELSAQLKEYEKELKQLNSATNNGATANAEQRNRMQQLRDSIAQCNTQIGTYRAAQTALRSEINSTNRELTEQQNAFAEASGAATTFGDVLKANLASDFINRQLQQTVEFLKQAVTYCYEVGSSFEAGMSKVAAVSGATADELERLTAKAKELGSKTKFNATEAAEAMNYMAMAGWKTQDMLNGIDGVLGLAAASGTDLATTSDIVTDALTAFGLKAQDCARFADVLAATSSNANTNVSMMGETFKYCAPIAGSLGFAAEDVAVNIGLMANSGIKASQAGTAMRTVLTKLSDDVTITGERIGELVIKTKNADGSMRELDEIIADLRGAFSMLSDSEKAAAADSIAGAYAMSGFLALMNAGEEDIAKLTSAIENCDGAASAMADTMEQNVQGAVTKFNSALEGVGVAIYDKFKDALAEAVNIYTECLSKMSDELNNGGELGQSFESLAESFKSAATEIANLAKDVLPDLVKGFSNVINFVIDFRKEIGAAVTGFIAFKSAMAITNLVQSVAQNFNILKAAILSASAAGTGLRGVVANVNNLTRAANSATAAQNGLNTAMKASPWGLVAAGVGVLVGVLSDVIMHAETAVDKIEQLRSESDEAAQSAENYANKANSLRDAQKRYDEIYNSEKSAYEKGEELKKLQSEIIAQCPELKGKIDLVTGAYNDQAAAIQKCIDGLSKYEEDEARAAFSKAQTAQNLDFESRITFDDYNGLTAQQKQELRDFITQNAKTLVEKDAVNFDFEGSYAEREEDYNLIYEYLKSQGLEQTSLGDKVRKTRLDLEQLANDFRSKQIEAEKYDADFAGSARLAEEWAAAQNPYDDEEEEPAAVAEQKLTVDELKKLYNEEKQLADDKYSVGEISAEEYYNTLKDLRDKYLQAQSHEWYQATAQIQSVYDKWTNAAKKSSTAVKSSLDEVQSAYKATLAAIDAEYEKHKRQKSDLEFQSKIDEIEKELQYGRVDEFERYELEKKKQQLIDEHDEELYSRSVTDAKSAVTDAYNARQALENADIGTREYTRALGDYTDKLGDLNEAMRAVGQQIGVQGGSSSSVNNIDESTKNNYINVILQAVNRSNSQIIDELMKALQSGI